MGKRLTGLLAGECTFSEEIKIKRHLDACPRCRRELEELKAVDGLLDWLTPDKAPPGLLDSIMEAVESTAAEQPGAAPAKPALRVLLKDVSVAAAAAMAAFWIGTGFFGPASSSAEQKISGAVSSYVQYTGTAVNRAHSSISDIKEWGHTSLRNVPEDKPF